MRAFFGADAGGGVSVSLSRDGKVLSRADGPGTSDLLGLLSRALKEAKAEKGAIREIAVDRGPGGFSAVRRRVAVATALARALGAGIAPVTSFANDVTGSAMTPEEAAALPASAFAARAPVIPLYAGAPNITVSKKRKTWTAR